MIESEFKLSSEPLTCRTSLYLITLLMLEEIFKLFKR